MNKEQKFIGEKLQDRHIVLRKGDVMHGCHAIRCKIQREEGSTFIGNYFIDCEITPLVVLFEVKL